MQWLQNEYLWGGIASATGAIFTYLGLRRRILLAERQGIEAARREERQAVADSRSAAFSELRSVVETMRTQIVGMQESLTQERRIRESLQRDLEMERRSREELQSDFRAQVRLREEAERAVKVLRGELHVLRNWLQRNNISLPEAPPKQV